jgi:RecA-family ATPase
MNRDPPEAHFDEHGTAERFPPQPLKLPTINVAAWDGVAVPPRNWAVRDRIARRNVTLLSGEGGVGKSILILQLACAHVFGGDWFGPLPERGPVIYLNAEDDERELHYRLDAIRAHLGTSFAALKDLHLVPLAGEDALLGTPDRTGIIKPTPLFAQLKQAATTIKPVLIALDTAADMFGGNENDRAQVRQFIGLLRGLAIAANAGVLLASHPSLQGINTDSGLSGSTGWHNSVRSRLYFKASEVSPDLRELIVRKNNYGPSGEVVRMIWRNGVFVPLSGPLTIEQAEADGKAERVFLDLLRRLAKQGRNVTDKKGTTFAPAIFAEEVEAKAAKVTKADLGEAMRRLFAANRITVVTEGPASRIRTRIVAVEGKPDDASTNTSTDPKTPSTNLPPNLPPLPPNTPLGGGRGEGVVEATAPPTTKPAGAGRFNRDPAGHLDPRKAVDLGNGQRGTIVGAAIGDACEHCGQSGGDVLLIRGTDEARAHALHEGCAAIWFGKTRRFDPTTLIA